MKIWTITTDTDSGLWTTVEFTEAAANGAALDIVQDWAARFDVESETATDWQTLLEAVQAAGCNDSLVIEGHDISHHPALADPVGTSIQLFPHGGDDPEEMNDKRANWAGCALNEFVQITNTDEEDALADLLADLMHLAHFRKWNFPKELARAVYHFTVETGGDLNSGAHVEQYDKAFPEFDAKG